MKSRVACYPLNRLKQNTLVGTLTFDLRKNLTFAGTSKTATRRNICAA